MACFFMDFTFRGHGQGREASARFTKAVDGMKARRAGSDGSGNEGKMEQRRI